MDAWLELGRLSADPQASEGISRAIRDEILPDASSSSSLVQSSSLVPSLVRPTLWKNLSGAAGDALAAQNRGTYKHLCDSETIRRASSAILVHNAAIKRDMHRTFTLFRRDPTATTIFSGRASIEMWEASLVRVLRGVVLRVPEVGYHQGLNYLAAVLLMVLHDVNDETISEKTEEVCFWMIVSLLRRKGFSGALLDVDVVPSAVPG